MEVIRAEKMGFCVGVRRAIDMMEKKAKTGSIQSLGSIVHNKQVVERLAQIGIDVIETLDQADSRTLAITSHGVGPDLVENARKKGLDIIDTTCPWVRKAQLSAKSLAGARFKVWVYGDPGHPEVKGILGWCAGSGFAGTDSQEALRLLEQAPKIGIVSQTTQSQTKLSQFVQEIVQGLMATTNELRVLNTICDATSTRQEAALALAENVESVVVVGDKHSSNSRRLAEICSSVGVKTFLIETAADIEPSWFDGMRRVGITTGASTPDWVTEEVMARLEAGDLGCKG